MNLRAPVFYLEKYYGILRIDSRDAGHLPGGQSRQKIQEICGSRVSTGEAAPRRFWLRSCTESGNLGLRSAFSALVRRVTIRATLPILTIAETIVVCSANLKDQLFRVHRASRMPVMPRVRQIVPFRGRHQGRR
jgi:hypothetical protein